MILSDTPLYLRTNRCKKMLRPSLSNPLANRGIARSARRASLTVLIIALRVVDVS